MTDHRLHSAIGKLEVGCRECFPGKVFWDDAHKLPSNVGIVYDDWRQTPITAGMLATALLDFAAKNALPESGIVSLVETLVR